MNWLDRFLASYSAVLAGLVLLLLGGAGVGVFLTFAGEGASTGAAVVGVLGAVGLTLGIALLVMAVRRRGGLLRSRTSAADRARYRQEYRGSADGRGSAR
ncbi:MAG: hypothetical protein SW019_00450 [Actinomycetota bacterium]|nr:hypothetical protein [Actinomycetota bacterium]